MKKAFTLIELIVAIAVFSIIIVYMYQAVSTTKKSVTSYESLYEKDRQNQIVKKILYNDIFNQTDPYKDTKISGSPTHSTYYLRTNNSLHNIPSPYVIYNVKNKNLYRFESIKPFDLPINDENKHHIKVDKLFDNVSLFTILSHRNDKLIQWVQNNQKTIFEISLPYSREIVIVGEN